MAAMEIRPLFYGLILVGIFHLTLPRSLDQKIQDAGEQFVQSKFVLGDGPVSIPLTTEQKWYDYKVRGRDEKLVKLQLDMIMTKEQWQTVIDTEDASPSRIRRNAVKDKVRLWPRRIPYVLSDAFNISDKFKLVMAMKHWEEHTCLEFVEADATDAFVIEFVSNEKSECYSGLGRIQRRHRNTINLGPGCMDKEIIVHEIGHALGLYHEHMRADRDDHVTVNYENMNNDTETHQQFDKLKAEHYNDYNKPYDYESIMHYGKLFYSKNKTADLITLETKDQDFLNVIGEALSLSFYDVKILSDMYKCSEGCMPRSCPGDGFLGKNCECYCKGKDSYDIFVCDKKDCGIPNNVSDFVVYTKNDVSAITSWDEGVAYPHGTQYIFEHKNTGCGRAYAITTCSDGQWNGGPPPCEKACYVDDFSDDYIVKNSDDENVKKGHKVVSQDGVDVMCSNGKLDDEYIECSDGVWNKQISGISCNKAHKRCRAPPKIPYAKASERITPYITFPHDTSVTYKCDVGKMATGSNSIVCNDGSWTSTTFTCQDIRREEQTTIIDSPVTKPLVNSRKSCAEMSIANGKIVASLKKKDLFDVICGAGFKLQYNTAYQCRDGVWIGLEPRCRPVAKKCYISHATRSRSVMKLKTTGETINTMFIDHWTQVVQTCKANLYQSKTVKCIKGRWYPSLMTCPRINSGSSQISYDVDEFALFDFEMGETTEQADVTSSGDKTTSDLTTSIHSSATTSPSQTYLTLQDQSPIKITSSSPTIKTPQKQDVKDTVFLDNVMEVTIAQTYVASSIDQTAFSVSSLIDSSTNSTFTQANSTSQDQLPSFMTSSSPMTQTTQKLDLKESVFLDNVTEVTTAQAGVTSSLDKKTSSLSSFINSSTNSTSIQPPSQELSANNMTSSNPTIQTSQKQDEKDTVFFDHVTEVTTAQTEVTSSLDMTTSDMLTISIHSSTTTSTTQQSILTSQDQSPGYMTSSNPTTSPTQRPEVKYRIHVQVTDDTSPVSINRNYSGISVYIDGSMTSHVKLDTTAYEITAENVGEINGIRLSYAYVSSDCKGSQTIVSIYKEDDSTDCFYIEKFLHPIQTPLREKPCKRYFVKESHKIPELNATGNNGLFKVYNESMHDAIACQLQCIETEEFNCSFVYYNDKDSTCYIFENAKFPLRNTSFETDFIYQRMDNC